MACIQPTLFHPLQQLPEGFEYNEDVLAFEEERALISTFERLPFREFEFRGFLGKRRTVSFGWRYDFNVRELQEAEEIPTFLLALRRGRQSLPNSPKTGCNMCWSLSMRRGRQSVGIGTDPNSKM
jgi:hypothetical protein